LTRNIFPILCNRRLRAIWVAILVGVSACTAKDHPRSPLSDAQSSGRSLRPALDWILSPGEIQVAEGHLRDFGYKAGPVDGLLTAQTQAAFRASQARDGLPVSGRLDRQTHLEWLPSLDQEAFAPRPSALMPS
jgi:hypothetical protein